MPYLPAHVPLCCGTRFEVTVETDGATRTYYCTICGELLADLIEGAEP